MCKSVGNRQNQKIITKIKRSSKINIKCYHKANSRGTILASIPTIFSNP